MGISRLIACDCSPDPVAPAVPWCSQLTDDGPCTKNGGCTWNATTKICQEGNLPTERRQLLDTDQLAEPPPQHCSAGTGVCQAAGAVTARQTNRMATLGALTGVSPPLLPGEVDAAAANVWLAARWREYLAR